MMQVEKRIATDLDADVVEIHRAARAACFTSSATMNASMLKLSRLLFASAHQIPQAIFHVPFPCMSVRLHATLSLACMPSYELRGDHR
jgi:hypothetical protein